MARTPPARPPESGKPTRWQLDTYSRAYIDTFAACARYGMKEEVCARYAGAAVDGLREKLDAVEDEVIGSAVRE